MAKLAGLADVSVTKTAQGAVLTVTAKNAADAERVQELAAELAARVAQAKGKAAGSDDCPHCHKHKKH